MVLKKKYRWCIGGIGCIIFVIALIIILPTIIAMVENNIIADDYLKKLTQLKPETTIVYKTYSKVGLLVGNGNHCDFFTLVIFRSSLNRKQVENYYKQINYDEYIYFLNNDNEKLLRAISNYYINDIIANLKHEISVINTESGTYYILYSFISNKYNGDLRCF